MILGRLLQVLRGDPAATRASTARPVARPGGDRPAVLNVGGGSKAIAIPPYYEGWEHHILDVEPTADVVCDALQMSEVIHDGSYDAIYCSHNLEHYYRHHVPVVLQSFARALKPDGFAEIRVPDIGDLIRIIATNKFDIEQEIYLSPAGPITAHDMIYGYGAEIEKSGEPWYAHKCGFTRDFLARVLVANGFPELHFTPPELHELRVYAFKQPATPLQKLKLNIVR